jgi:hypothetical protein
VMDDLERTVFTTQARISLRATDDTLLTIARQRAFDPSIFDAHPPFIWANEISSDRLDSYFTYMDAETTLPNYAREAAAGVSFLIGHNTHEMPIGQTLTGTLATEGDVTRVLADAYALTEPATETFINRVRAGIQKDDSIGFHGGQWICSICGLDMLRDYSCYHIPSMSYEIKDASSGSTTMRDVLCTATVKNAHLSEVSAVYDGATPGAAVLQAQRAAEAGRMTVSQARLIEQRYRINLPGKRLITQGVSMPPESNGHAAAEERELQTLLELAGVPGDRTGLDRVRWLVEELARQAPQEHR